MQNSSDPTQHRSQPVLDNKSKPGAASILVVDDHEVVRQGLADLIKVILPLCSFMEATSGEQALELVETHRPTVALIDFRLPGMNGVETTRRIKAEHPETRIVVYTLNDGFHYRRDAYNAGADCFLLKSQPGSELVRVLKDLMNRETSQTGHTDLVS